MSTYTDLHNRLKENVTIIHHPNFIDDGVTPQLVKFMNPENEYYGKFCGSFEGANGSLSGVSISNASISGATLVSSVVNGIDLDQLGSKFEALEELFNETLPLCIGNLVSADEQLRTCQKKIVDFCVNELSAGLDYISSQVSDVIEDSKTIGGDLEYLSSRISGVELSTTDAISSLKDEMSIASSDAIAISKEYADDVARDASEALESTSDVLRGMIESTSANLEYKISNVVEADKHYSISMLSPIEGVVYEAKDYAMNLITPNPGVASLVVNNIWCGQVTTTSQNTTASTQIDKIGIDFYNISNIPSLANKSFSLKRGESYYTEDNCSLIWVADETIASTEISSLDGDTIIYKDASGTEIATFSIKVDYADYDMFVAMPKAIPGHLREFGLRFDVPSRTLPGDKKFLFVKLQSDAGIYGSTSISYEWHGEEVEGNMMGIELGKTSTIKFQEIAPNLFTITDFDDSLIWADSQRNTDHIVALEQQISSLLQRVTILENKINTL